MDNILTLGSLFDGSGTFPVAGMLAGIKPVWASEIEPFPIRVTTERLPWMKHYGDVSKINGAEIEPVDIITFGSPCTDLSVAGKRAGLTAERSGLFFQAVRVIKEMRCATNGKNPRYAVWENVPGAYSSNGGEDFRCVLEELCKAKDPTMFVPRPEKWEKCGEIVAENFSLAWRTVSAEFWGVPQRRMRIYLVVDFDGECAGKILFESEGLSRYSASSFAAWQDATRSAENRTGATGNLGLVLNDQGGNRMDVTDDMTCTLRAEAHHPPCVLESAGFCTEHSSKARGIGYEEETSPTLRAGVVPAAIAVENHPTDSRVKISDDGMVQTLTSRCGTGGGNVPLLLQAYGICGKHSNSMLSDNPHSGFYEADSARTIDTSNQSPCKNQGGIVVIEGNGSRPSHQGDGYKEAETMYTLNATENHSVSYGIDRAAYNQGKNALYNFAVETELEPTLVAKGPGAVAHVASFYPQMKAESQCFRDDDISTTLVNGTNPGYQNAVVYSTSKASYHTRAEEELANTLVASDYKDPPVVNDQTPKVEYIVRRLLPQECALLQGMPTWWCSGLETAEPTDEDINWWDEVFETHRQAIGSTAKPKTRSAIEKWLKNPHSDSAEYKMWGNGIAAPNAFFVLSGIAYYADHAANCERTDNK